MLRPYRLHRLLRQLQEGRHGANGNSSEVSGKDCGGRDSNAKYHLRQRCCEKAAQDPVGHPAPAEPRAVLSSLQACLLPTAEVFQNQDQQIRGLFPANSCQTAQTVCVRVCVCVRACVRA